VTSPAGFATLETQTSTATARSGGPRIVAPFGFYGWGNIGDESTLQGFAQLVKSRGRTPSVWIASRDPGHTGRVEPSFKYFSADWNAGLGNRLRRRWAHYRATATVFPGGTPIMDGLGAWPLEEVAPLVRAAHEANRPVAFVGSGTERLHRPESREIVARILAPAVRHWTVRSDHDKERLVSWGVPEPRVTVAADLAWLLPPQSDQFGTRTIRALNLFPNERFIGVNLNNEKVILERDPQFFEKMATFLDRLIGTSHAPVLLFCSEVREGPTFDKAAAEKVRALMRRSDRAAILPNKYWTPQELLSLIACCQIVVSMRYHVCLFSALQGVPFIAVQRSDKVRDLCSDISWEYGVTLDKVDVPVLLDQAGEIEQRRGTLVDRLRTAAAIQARHSLRNNVALDALSAAEPLGEGFRAP
jgi:polysaccharide pyruvyl transferase WcaK-like protein